MKSLVFGAVVSGALISSSYAADMPVKAAPAPLSAVATYNWTGFYAGGTAGYGWQRSDVNQTATNTFCNPILGGCPPFVFPGGLPADVGSAAAVPGTLSPNAKGGIFGLTFGYNSQFGRWVAGLETDFSLAGISGTDTRAGGPAVVVPGAGGTSILGTGTAETKLRSFGTVRARLGYTPIDPLLLYATGGLAYGRVSSNVTISETVVGPCGVPLGCPVTPATGGSSSTRMGWTLGGGAEYAFAGRWSVKGEYLYYDLGSVTYGLSPLTSTGNAGGVPAPFTAVSISSQTAHFKGSILRLGLNYRFSP